MVPELVGEEKQFVEEVGITFENTGLPRMAGRIFGWLLISDPPQQSPAELASVLRVSRGSISNMTRFLVQMGLIERISLLGERTDYFRINPNNLSPLMKHGFDDEIRMFRQLAEHGMKLLAGREHPCRNLMEDMHQVYSFLEREFPLLIERWEKGQAGSRLGAG